MSVKLLYFIKPFMWHIWWCRHMLYTLVFHRKCLCGMWLKLWIYQIFFQRACAD